MTQHRSTSALRSAPCQPPALSLQPAPAPAPAPRGFAIFVCPFARPASLDDIPLCKTSRRGRGNDKNGQRGGRARGERRGWGRRRKCMRGGGGRRGGRRAERRRPSAPSKRRLVDGRSSRTQNEDGGGEGKGRGEMYTGRGAQARGAKPPTTAAPQTSTTGTRTPHRAIGRSDAIRYGLRGSRPDALVSPGAVDGVWGRRYAVGREILRLSGWCAREGPRSRCAAGESFRQPPAKRQPWRRPPCRG